MTNQVINPHTGLPLTERQQDVLGQIYRIILGDDYFYENTNKTLLTPLKTGAKVKK